MLKDEIKKYRKKTIDWLNWALHRVGSISVNELSLHLYFSYTYKVEININVRIIKETMLLQK